MSWKIAIVIALLTGLATAVVTAPVADHVTKKMKVSDREGGRGYLVVFLILAGFAGGAVIGAITTGAMHAAQWGQFWRTCGVAVVAGQAALFAIAGLCLLSAPRPPLLDGRTLALQVELFVPADLRPKDPPDQDDLSLSLYAGKDDNRYVDIPYDRLRLEEGTLVIPAEAPLNTISAERMLSLTVNDTMGYTLDLPLRPSPRRSDLDWTERMPLRLSRVTGTAYTYTSVLARYRVVMKGPARTDR